MEIGTPPHYTETQIRTPNRAGILSRNQRKRQNINRLSACSKIAGIPYSMYYFSLNLDHVLHGKTNISEWEKIRCAEEFDLKYGDDPDGFTLFMKESSFSVCDDYLRSWAFIKTELHSLERFSNFGIELPPVETAEFKINYWYYTTKGDSSKQLSPFVVFYFDNKNWTFDFRIPLHGKEKSFVLILGWIFRATPHNTKT